MRWRYGDTYPVQKARATGFAIAIDDMCYWDPLTQSDVRPDTGSSTLGVAKSAASFPWQGSLAATQAAFAAQFLGVSGQRWPVTGNNPPVFGGQDGYVRINTGGVYEFAFNPANTWLDTQLVGPDFAGTSLLPQQVAVVSSRALAIGRIERPQSVLGTGSVYVRIFTAEYSPLTNA